LKLPASGRDLESYRAEIQKRIRSLLKLGTASGPLAVRHLVTTPRKRYRVEKLEFLSEPGIYIPAWVFVPAAIDPGRPAALFVQEAGKQPEGMEFGLFERLAQAGQLVAAVDVRGVGDTRVGSSSGPGGRPFQHLFDTETAMSYMAWYMDESLFGMRVHDVVRSLDYLLSRTDVGPSGVRVIGKGMGALWVLYAAALDRRIHTAICENGLLSYRTLVRADRYLHGANIFVRNVLRHFDLPQVAAAIAGRRLILVSPVDAMKRPVALRHAAKEYEWTRSVYGNAAPESRFEIVTEWRDDLAHAAGA
jgi:cephalosporin-C deacetylase-like acetyl esterase